jgi:hypothetical protein
MGDVLVNGALIIAGVLVGWVALNYIGALLLASFYKRIAKRNAKKGQVVDASALAALGIDPDNVEQVDGDKSRSKPRRPKVCVFKIHMGEGRPTIEGVSVAPLHNYPEYATSETLPSIFLEDGDSTNPETYFWENSVITTKEFGHHLGAEQIARRAHKCKEELAAYKKATKEYRRSLIAWGEASRAQREALATTRMNLIIAIKATYAESNADEQLSDILHD